MPPIFKLKRHHCNPSRSTTTIASLSHSSSLSLSLLRASVVRVCRLGPPPTVATIAEGRVVGTCAYPDSDDGVSELKERRSPNLSTAAASASRCGVVAWWSGFQSRAR
ncbi:hypothetical protein Tsubulata_013237 [Turnera subulata]|uniref:Uncharacterized protein n=1 Tax=Turnera subulata TaxID=218843 RepID=A0A9Q0FDT8_9ROSI|nr:hypothetical protein Tsubulata_013237 [Turnera subulata]